MNSSATHTLTAAAPWRPASASASANTTHSTPARRMSPPGRPRGKFRSKNPAGRSASRARSPPRSASQAQLYGANTRVHDCSEAIEPIASALRPRSLNHSGA